MSIVLSDIDLLPVLLLFARLPPTASWALVVGRPLSSSIFDCASETALLAFLEFACRTIPDMINGITASDAATNTIIEIIDSISVKPRA